MQASLTGFDRFQSAMAELAEAYVKPAWEAKKRGESLARPTDTAFEAVFHGFNEITGAVEALALTEALIALAAPRSKRIKKDEYLKFLVGAYLQEVYILEQRLSAYAKKICRLYKLSTEAQALAADVQDAFGGITRTRGSHVHSERYSDERLDMLSSLALISTFKVEFTDDMHFEYKFVQNKWRNTVKVNNAATRAFLDRYFDQLFHHISKSGQFVLPRTGRGSGHEAHVAA